MRSLAILAMLVAVAGAKPLPKGMTIGVAKNRLVATRDGVTVPITDGPEADWEKLVKAELSDKGDELVIDAPSCHGMNTEPTTFALAGVEARLENAIGMGFHVKKQYDKAIQHFALAVAKEPREVYETNLLSAQSLGGKLDDADKTLATYGAKAHGWFGWRLAVDSDLAPLKGRPSLKGYEIKPGSARIGKFDMAYSPLGLVAVGTGEIGEGVGSPSDDFLSIADTATGVELMRLPLGTQCGLEDGGDPSTGPSKACVKKQAALAAPLIKKADAVLAQLGFEPVPKTAVRTMFGEAKAISAPDGRKLTFDEDTGHLVVGGKKSDIDTPRTGMVGFVPKAIVLSRRHKGQISCDDGMYFWTVEVTPTP